MVVLLVPDIFILGLEIIARKPLYHTLLLSTVIPEPTIILLRRNCYISFLMPKVEWVRGQHGMHSNLFLFYMEYDLFGFA